MEILNDAKDQISKFENEINSFFQSNPYKRVIEHNTKESTDTHKIKLIREIPGQFRSRTRHIASDIRSSLDHIGYAAAIASGKINPKKTYFPFGKSIDEENNLRNRNCKDYPKEIFDVFWSFKPYIGGNSLLWALNEIANCNKHRAIVPIGHGLAGGQMMDHFSCDGLCHFMGFPPIWDSEANEATLCIVDSTANTNYEISLTFGISFGDIDIVKGTPILDTLKALHNLAERIILASDAEGIRIGIFA